MPGIIALHVDQALGRSLRCKRPPDGCRGCSARRACAHGSPWPAQSRPPARAPCPACWTRRSGVLSGCTSMHHGVEQDLDGIDLFDLVDKALGVFRAGQLLDRNNEGRSRCGCTAAKCRRGSESRSSTRIERAPALCALSAAARPAGPPPTMATSTFLVILFRSSLRVRPTISRDAPPYFVIFSIGTPPYSGDQLHHARGAEAALAAPHACASAALNAVQRGFAQRALDGVNDLRLGDAFAAADDTTVARVFGNRRLALLFRHVAESLGEWARAMGFKSASCGWSCRPALRSAFYRSPSAMAGALVSPGEQMPAA